MSKRKILCIIQLPPPSHGVTKMNHAMVNSNAIQNYCLFDIVALKFSRNLRDIGYARFSKLVPLLRIWFNMIIKLVSNHYDLAYFTVSLTGLAFYRDILYVFLLKGFRLKIVFHLYGKGTISSYHASYFQIILYKWMFSNSHVILQSKLLYNEMEDFIPRENIYILPNGIVKNILFQRNTENNPPKILFLSGLIKFKGPLVLLEALNVLAKRNIRFEAIFGGASYDVSPQEFKELTDKYSLKQYVKYVGFVSSDEKTDLFMSSSIFVLPTLNDAFPLSILEAMEASLPVVSTFEGAIPEVVDNGITGYLVAKGDCVALAEKIELLLNNSDLRTQMGNAGREKFLANFTMERFENNFIEILEKICAAS